MKIIVMNKDEVKRFLDNLAKAKTDPTKLMQAGFFIQNEVKASIAGQRGEPRSVDTGQFLNSVAVRSVDKDVEIYSDVPQAIFMEYGTSRIEARSHFRNTASRIKKEIKEIIK
jgi:hypothetical protein